MPLNVNLISITDSVITVFGAYSKLQTAQVGRIKFKVKVFKGLV